MMFIMLLSYNCVRARSASLAKRACLACEPTKFRQLWLSTPIRGSPSMGASDPGGESGQFVGHDNFR